MNMNNMNMKKESQRNVAWLTWLLKLFLFSYTNKRLVILISRPIVHVLVVALVGGAVIAARRARRSNLRGGGGGCIRRGCDVARAGIDGRNDYIVGPVATTGALHAYSSFTHHDRPASTSCDSGGFREAHMATCWPGKSFGSPGHLKSLATMAYYGGTFHSGPSSGSCSLGEGGGGRREYGVRVTKSPPSLPPFFGGWK
jgi:hypothetical protein